MTNDEVIEKYDKLYPDTLFNPGKVKTLRTAQPELIEINKFVVENINKAEKYICIV